MKSEREIFENWYKQDVGESLCDLSRETSGAYVAEDAQSCWEGWFARSLVDRNEEPTK